MTKTTTDADMDPFQLTHESIMKNVDDIWAYQELSWNISLMRKFCISAIITHKVIFAQ